MTTLWFRPKVISVSTASPTTNRRSEALHSPAVLAWLRMNRVVSRTHQAAAELLRQRGLTHAQFAAIAQVGAGRDLTQQELAKRLLVTQGNVCQLLDGLEKKGLVKRQKVGRSNHLHLTPRGQEVFSEVVPEHEKWQASRMNALTEAEQKELLRLLRKLDHSQK